MFQREDYEAESFCTEH